MMALVPNFTDTITLSCSPGSCAFNPSEIALGVTNLPSSSTLTLSGLSAGSSNPYIFTVNGSDVPSGGSDISSLTLALYLQDFSLSASPAVATIQSGQSASYTVTVSPVNNFGQSVALTCATPLPQGVSCLANPAALRPNGGAANSVLTVSTTAQSTSTVGHLLPRVHPRIPPPTLMMLALWGACYLLMLAALWIRGKRRSRATAKRGRLIYAQVALATLALAAAFWMSCDTNIYTNVIQQAPINGTPTGTYTIQVLGTFTGSTAGTGITTGTQTKVVRTTSVNLVVQ